MRRDRIELIAAIALLVGIAALVYFAGVKAPAARSEEGESTYDPGPYGMPESEIKKIYSPESLFRNIKPIVPLKDLPPMPPLFGPKPAGWPEPKPEKAISEMTPQEKDLHDRIEWLKNRKMPWEKTTAEQK